ncbi:hypothetical protein BDR22DRAFT_976090 [Usnea florida]
MDPQYSTLEHIRYDETAGALQRDHDSMASVGSQGNEDSNKERAPSLHIVKHGPKWLWVIIALVVTAAVAVGVAVGIWRHREHSHHSLPVSQNHSTPLSQNHSTPVSQNHSTIPSGQFILNDTSLAATYDANGNRYLFFQDSTGHIQAAVRTDGDWSTRMKLGINSNAKDYTPLAATSTNASNEFNEPLITVYYVSEGHVLNSSTYTAGYWKPDIQPGDLSSGNFSTAVNTRSLSVANTGSFFNSSLEDLADLALLYYENPTGNVSALCQVSYDVNKGSRKSLPDVFRNAPSSESKTLDESLILNNSTLSAPFTSQVVDSQQLSALFYFHDLLFGFQSDYYLTGPSGPGNFSTATPSFMGAIPSYSSIYQSDIATFGVGNVIWFNHTNVTVSGRNEISTPPDNSFPYARLASITLADKSHSYLYHQINGTTLAEEQWDNAIGAWVGQKSEGSVNGTNELPLAAGDLAVKMSKNDDGRRKIL